MPLLDLFWASCQRASDQEVVEVTPGAGMSSPAPTLLGHRDPSTPEVGNLKSDQREEAKDDREEGATIPCEVKQQEILPPHPEKPVMKIDGWHLIQDNVASGLEAQTSWQLSSASQLLSGSGLIAEGPPESAEQDEGQQGLPQSEQRYKRPVNQKVKAARAEQREQAKELVRPFLAQHGFETVKSSRRKMMRTCYPLHVAVKANNVELTQRLLRAGADPFKVDSSGRTPLDLAQRLNSAGSHKKVVEVLKRSTRNGKHWVPWLRASGGLSEQVSSEATHLEGSISSFSDGAVGALNTSAASSAVI